MAKLSPEKIEKWLATGEKLMGSPITSSVFAAIAPFLPKAGLTPEQIAAMKARAVDASEREKKARRRAGQIVVLLLLASASPALAQNTSYTLRTFNVGAAAPISTFTFPASEVTCNQPAVTVPAQVVNGRVVAWDDAANAGRTCRWSSSAANDGPLFALPFGGPYDSTLTATNAAGDGPESAHSNPFVRLAPPAVLTTVRIVPGG